MYNFCAISCGSVVPKFNRSSSVVLSIHLLLLKQVCGSMVCFFEKCPFSAKYMDTFGLLLEDFVFVMSKIRSSIPSAIFKAIKKSDEWVYLVGLPLPLRSYLVCW